MRNHFVNLKIVNCAYFLYTDRLSSASKYANEVSIFACRHNMNVKTTNSFCMEKHSYAKFSFSAVQTLSAKMLIAALCAFYAEDSSFEENRIGAIHILWFYKLDFS